jgi:DNA-nicking Smr family endonuclease
MKELDLHGMTHSEAVLEAENFVLLESQNELFECRLITGNSMKMKSVIVEMLERHDFKWWIPNWNTGEIIVHY